MGWGGFVGCLAKGTVAPHQLWLPFRRQIAQDLPQSRLGVLGRMLIARTDFDAEHPPGAGYQVGVVTVRGSARLSRVVGNNGAFLMALQRLEVVSVSRIQGTSSSRVMLPDRWVSSQLVSSASGMRLSALRSASSEITLPMPSNLGFTTSQRLWSDRMDSIQVPRTSALLVAFGLL